jgi:hypothetical protein
MVADPAAQCPPEPARDRGAGMLGTAFGLTVVLGLLTVAVQLLLNLQAASVVTAAAHDSARLVASDVPVAAAEAHARDLLGGLADGARFEWDRGDPDVVRLRVVARAPRVLVPLLELPLGLDDIERTATARVERPQGG